MRRYILKMLGVLGVVASAAIFVPAHAGDPPHVSPYKKDAVTVAKDIKVPAASGLSCIQTSSSGHQACKDAGGYDSTCATASCPSGYSLTGGGGSCSAGDRKVKSVFPRVERGEYTIVCEQQGVSPQANAICCKL